MAGDWIRIRNDLAEDPAVVWMSRHLPEELAALPEQLKRNLVVGCLCRVWSWADRHTADGRVPPDPDCEEDVTQERFRCNAILYLDEIAGLNSFANLLISVAWLSVKNGEIEFPHWERYMTESAKRRALTAKRVQSYRKRRTCNASSLPEKRREEKRTKEPKGSSVAALSRELISAWNSAEGFRKATRFSGKRMAALRARAKDAYWRENWKAALAHAATLPALRGENDRNWVADLDWFLRADTALKLMEGKYDSWGPAKGSGKSWDAIDWGDGTAETKRQAEETF